MTWGDLSSMISGMVLYGYALCDDWSTACTACMYCGGGMDSCAAWSDRRAESGEAVVLVLRADAVLMLFCRDSRRIVWSIPVHK